MSEPKTLKWEMSNRLVSYFASSIYGQDFGVIAMRELLQNAIDAKAKVFSMRVDTDKDIKIFNDGIPLDLEVIEHNLFNLGNSTKQDGTQDGFFGVGECAVIAPCEHWKIESGKYKIEDYILTETTNIVNGTVHTLTLTKNIAVWRVKRFLQYQNVPLKISLQKYGINEVIARKTYAKCRKYTIPHGVFTWVKSGESVTVLRVKGLPQHIAERYDKAGTFVIDLDTSTILTVNRESIRDEETNTAIDKIKEELRQLAEHVSTDENTEYLQISTTPLFYREKGHVLRRNVQSEPVQKIHNCVKIVHDAFKQLVPHNTNFALLACDTEVSAVYYQSKILINVEDRNINPPTAFTLQLIDDYTHELAHALCGCGGHAEKHAELRAIAWKHTEIIEAVRSYLRTA